VPLLKFTGVFLLLSKITDNLYIKVNDDEFIPLRDYFWLDSISELADKEEIASIDKKRTKK